MNPLAGWENFYVIVGSSAGALIGLQFVVITLIADMPAVRDMERAGSAYSTPTIVHFGAALLLSAAISAPWQDTHGAAIVWGLLGLAGVVYQIVVIRRIRTQVAYDPVFEDWLFHVLLPLAAYATLAVSAWEARSDARGALFAVAAASLVLLFVGIHNAWDAVTYHVVVKKSKDQGEAAE
ncbi:MAG TPA: hypothetical protein VKB58_06505 [Terriglobales bacterium]|jgi:hypothetical protein|nr:hypothetical protein [Terriglobales bacterium]